MKLLKNILCASVFVVTAITSAQQNPNRSFFKQTMNLVNPAFAGSKSTEADGLNDRVYDANPEIGINFRSQWSGVDGAPETQSAFFSMGIGRNVGLGIAIINDRTFIEDQTAIALDFSYRLKINTNNDLFLGVKAGAASYKANLSGLMIFGIGSDPSLNNIDGSFNPTIGAGVLLKGKQYFIALSTPNFLTSERLVDNDGTARLGQSRSHYYIAAGYDLKISKSIALKSAAIANFVEAAPFSLELNTMLSFDNKIEIGPSYRFNEGLGGLLILNAANWLDIGYAYETAPNGPVAAKSNGSHEVLLKLKL